MSLTKTTPALYCNIFLKIKAYKKITIILRE